MTEEKQADEDLIVVQDDKVKWPGSWVPYSETSSDDDDPLMEDIVGQSLDFARPKEEVDESK